MRLSPFFHFKEYCLQCQISAKNLFIVFAIGMIAPQGCKAVYMGYSFLYGVIGSLFGSSIGAALYTQIAKPGHPTLFFLIFCALGLLGFVGLLWFKKQKG
jgi:hypothetical protein